jgi:hypothetical protein
VAQQRRELQQSEAQLRQFRGRLAQIEGKQASRPNVPFRMLFRVQPKQGAQKPKATDKKGKAVVFPNRLILRIQDGKIIGVTGKKEKRDPLQDIEARLDRLLKEVEALRRDVERTLRPRK